MNLFPAIGQAGSKQIRTIGDTMKSQENLEKYLVHQNPQILQTLKLLVKHKCLITARFEAGKYSFVTVVIDVLKDKNLVILDYGADELINKKLLAAPRVTFTTVHNGVRVQFSAEQITQAKFKGNTVFAAPIPDSVLWLERREYYRVKVPLNESVCCRIPLQEDRTVQLYVLDISITGLALHDLKGAAGLPDEIDSIVSNCNLLLPEYETTLDFQVKNQITVPSADDTPDNQRIGCAFVNPTQAFQSNIMRFMQYVERQTKQLDR